MGIFGSKKADAPKKEAVATKAVAPRDLSGVIVRPRVTEKALLGVDRNVYTFEVRRDATKYDVRDAVKELYNVTPVKVRTVTQQPRRVMKRTKGRVIGVKGLKKAYVYLKEGDKIDLA